MTWILTSTGRRVDFADPSPDTIDIIDIANGLSKQCRFSGQCRAHYSVAQHCVLVSAIVPRHAAMAALLHDAAEAYMHDMPSPLKQMLPEFQTIERRLQDAILAHFGVQSSDDDRQAIAHTDLVLLATEQEQHRLVPDLTLVNDGTLADLYQQVDEALANLITTLEARTKTHTRRIA